jgi:hypothetical protein
MEQTRNGPVARDGPRQGRSTLWALGVPNPKGGVVYPMRATGNNHLAFMEPALWVFVEPEQIPPGAAEHESRTIFLL